MVESVEQGTATAAGEAVPAIAPDKIAPRKDATAPKRAVRKARAAPAPAVTSAPADAVVVVTEPVALEAEVAPEAEAEPAVVTAPAKAETAAPAPAKTIRARTAPARKPVAKAAKSPKPTPKPTKPAAAAAPRTPPARTVTAPSKEPRIMTTATTEITEKFQTALKDASEKAKAAFEKNQANLGELGAFTKGNVEALVESSKILATGLQELSKGYLTESKSAFETLTAEFKELAAVKSPSELLEKQSTLLRKQFDAAVAASSKNSEAVLKLVNEAFQPISTRVSLAVEKVKKAA